MSDPHRRKAEAFWNATGVGTNAGVTVTKAATVGKKHVVTHISGSGDAAALITIESPASTVIWRQRASAAGGFSFTFPPGELECASNTAVLVKVSASTSNSEANIAGYTITG